MIEARKSYRFSGLSLPYQQGPCPTEALQQKVLVQITKALGKRNAKAISVEEMTLVRRSLDARKKHDIRWVFTVDVQLSQQGKPLALPRRPGCGFEEAPVLAYHLPDCGQAPMLGRPVIAGFGPCGMFAALTLARAGYQPLVLERGRDVETRSRDVEDFWAGGPLNPASNVQFGEGGAGTFSDGKLTTGIRDPRIRQVLEDLVSFGADPDVRIDAKPHIGTDVLKGVVKALREEVIRLGGEVRFGCRLTGVEAADGQRSVAELQADKRSGAEMAKRQLIAVRYETPDGREERIPASALLLACGHSARDTFADLQQAGIPMTPKPFSMGVRIQHPQRLIDEAQYGAENLEEKRKWLPPADYKLSWHCANGRGVYTFCMCPGGEIIQAASQEGHAVTNGMSLSARDSGKANSGLLVDVRVSDYTEVPEEEPLAGVRYQETWERKAFLAGGYRGPVATWGQVQSHTAEGKALAGCLPEYVLTSIQEAMPHLGKKLHGFDGEDALLIGVETRSSSPVRILRGEDYQSPALAGFFPGGEGCGYAGGIMSAACDGMKVAEQIIQTYEKPTA